MLDNSIIKLAAWEIIAVNDQEVVKVAGLLRRIRNWFKSFMNSEYAAQVAELKDEIGDLASLVSSMNESLGELDDSIKDLDVGSYHASLMKVRSIIPQFIEKLNKLDDVVQEADDGIPNAIKSNTVADEPRDLEPEPPAAVETIKQWKHYDEPKSVTEVGEYNEVSIKTAPLERAKRNIKLALENMGVPAKDITKMLKGDDRNALFTQFKRAILGGTVLALRTAPVGKPKSGDRDPNRVREDFHLLIEIDPFVIPDTNIKLAAKVSVHEHNKVLNLAETSVFEAEKIQPPSIPLQDQVDAPEIAPDEPLSGSLSDAGPGAGYEDEGNADAPLFGYASRKARKQSLEKFAITRLPQRYAKIGGLGFANAARQAYKEMFGEDPTAQTLGLIWAQAAVESGSDFNLLNNNVGYVKATDRWLREAPDRMYTQIDAEEHTPDGKIRKIPSKFRAFASPKDGIKSYLQVLRKNFPESFRWKAAGLAVCDAAYLSENGYYTAPMNKYAAGMDSLFNKFMTSIAPKMEPQLENAAAPPPGKCPVLRITKAKVGEVLDSGKVNNPLAWPTKSLKFAWSGELNVNPEANVGGVGSASSIQERVVSKDRPFNPTEEYQSAMRYLFAEGTITGIVRRALEKQLPSTKVLIKVNADNVLLNGNAISSVPVLSEYSHILVSALRDEIDGIASVHSDEGRYEIVCEAVGSSQLVKNSVREVAELVAAEFVSAANDRWEKMGRDMQISKINVKASIGSSELPLASLDNMLRNNRKFAFAVSL